VLQSAVIPTSAGAGRAGGESPDSKLEPEFGDSESAATAIATGSSTGKSVETFRRLPVRLSDPQSPQYSKEIPGRLAVCEWRRKGRNHALAWTSIQVAHWQLRQTVPVTVKQEPERTGKSQKHLQTRRHCKVSWLTAELLLPTQREHQDICVTTQGWWRKTEDRELTFQDSVAEFPKAAVNLVARCTAASAVASASAASLTAATSAVGRDDSKCPTSPSFRAGLILNLIR
jgi:hypothetical protein